MATYRVGAKGATVFNKDGKAVSRLLPGYVVVEDIVVTAKTKPAAKRVKKYSDKKVRPAEDKSL